MQYIECPSKNMNNFLLLVAELKILYLEFFKVKLKAKKVNIIVLVFH